MRPIIDWGTYNALSSLTKARLLGLRLTEIPPGDFMRRGRGEDYFIKYAQDAKPAFTTITAHGPYYDPRDREGLKAHIAAVKRAEKAGARVYNIHMGRVREDRGKDLEEIAGGVKRLLEESDDIVVTLETACSPGSLGSIEDVREVVDAVGSERVGISLQLENDFIREFKIYESGDFHGADKSATERFWLGLLKRAKDLFPGCISLRFSQVIGMRRRAVFLKKRTPLGMGYPDVGPLTRALARFIADVFSEGLGTEIHIVYTGPPETKYRDTLLLYYHIAREIADCI